MEAIQKIRMSEKSLRFLCTEALVKVSMSEEDARITTDVLLSADLRGIDSHGIARLGFYLEHFREGVVRQSAQSKTISETPTTALIDADGGMGQPAAYRAMQLAIHKAQEFGLGLVTVRNSNHYGIAGYYAMMALEYDCIGMSMTNTSVFVVPTFGRDAMLGTNPIAVAAPAGKERPFVLDMATSTVPFGKLETYERLDKPIPLGWATDEIGQPSTDPSLVINNMRNGPLRGGLTPLGGDSELTGGHKGYGLVLLVDILCGVLPGALYADLINPIDENGNRLPSGIGHIFQAVRVDAIRPIDEFKASMDNLQRRLKDSPKAEGQDRIYIHGEKEYEEIARRKELGIPLAPKVIQELEWIAREFKIKGVF